jgi:flavin-dependent dehydrogenase
LTARAEGRETECRLKIGIVGARLAGSYAAQLLARSGHEVLLIDPDPEDEKACGGGVTAKAYRNVPWFREHSLPCASIRSVRLIGCNGRHTDLHLEHPIQIYSRSTLDGSLREGALTAGVRHLPEHVRGLTRRGNAWLIHTQKSDCEVDFVVGADGAKSTVRACLVGRFAKEDLALALGYRMPGQSHSSRIVVGFQEPGFVGYIWSFPRTDHVSIGILRWLPQANAVELKQRLSRFMAQMYTGDIPGERFYAACIPSLDRLRLSQQRVCGSNWALLGDAAGFVDAITGEGIYYALRSAELLAKAIENRRVHAYEQYWREDFGADLMRAARWRDRFYGAAAFWPALNDYALRSAARHPDFSLFFDRLVAGQCTYRGAILKAGLRSPAILFETLRSRLFRPRAPLRAHR